MHKNGALSEVIVLDICYQGHLPEQQSEDFNRYSLFVKKLLTKEVASINYFFLTLSTFCSCCKRVGRGRASPPPAGGGASNLPPCSPRAEKRRNLIEFRFMLKKYTLCLHAYNTNKKDINKVLLC